MDAVCSTWTTNTANGRTAAPASSVNSTVLFSVGDPSGGRTGAVSEEPHGRARRPPAEPVAEDGISKLEIHLQNHYF